MISIDFVRTRFGATLDAFASNNGCDIQFSRAAGDDAIVLIRWVTPNRLKAMIAMACEDDGYELMTFLNDQSVVLGRLSSWETPRGKVRARLVDLKGRLDSYFAPPLGFLNTREVVGCIRAGNPSQATERVLMAPPEAGRSPR